MRVAIGSLFFYFFSIYILSAQQPSYKIMNISENTKYSDFGVVPFGDEQVVFASSRKDKTRNKRFWSFNKQPYLELYKGEVGNDGEIINVTPFSDKINTKYHESNLAVTKDLKTIYFTRNNYLNNRANDNGHGQNLIQLYKAQQDSLGNWSHIEPLPFTSNSYQTGHPVLNAKEDKLFFVSDMPGSIGETDIYVVDIFSDGSYGTPKNLGPNVNTAGKEMFPYIDDNDILYFSSNGFQNGIGGLDIYAAEVLGNTVEKQAVNLGTIINSPKDDFSFVFVNNKRQGYFSSNRGGGKGDDDIYFFTENTPISFSCPIEITGVVKNKKGNALSNAQIKLYTILGELIESTTSNTKGEFSLHKGGCNTSYRIVGSLANYDDVERNFITQTVPNQTKVALTLVQANKDNVIKEIRGLLMISINPIYFDLNEAIIKDQAARELEKIIRVMNKYPNIKVDLRAHTDSRGSEENNLILSTLRANSVKRWLINRGIANNRLTENGFGETKPVYKCGHDKKCTEIQHQLNRRTEFVIVNPEAITVTGN